MKQPKFTLVDHGPFDTTAPRFRDSAQAAEAPGPGAYDVASSSAAETVALRRRAAGMFLVVSEKEGKEL